MKIKIKKAEIVKDKYGQHIQIKLIGLYDDQGKWIKWAKHNEAMLDVLTNAEIEVHIEQNQ